MRIARLERVRWHERGSVIGAQPVFLLQHHGEVEGARGLVANLNVGMEEGHVAEPLAERDALMNDAGHDELITEPGIASTATIQCTRPIWTFEASGELTVALLLDGFCWLEKLDN
jgi:hypothetical protein